MLQLEPLLDRKPKALSGGQRQRVAIGRAIVREPGVFLFDEPLSNLDAALRVQTRFEIAKIHRDFGKASTVYVTHDQVEAMTLADRIVLLNTGEAVARDGSVAQFGSPLELYHRPRNMFVAGFIGSPKMNFLRGHAASRPRRTRHRRAAQPARCSRRGSTRAAVPPGAARDVGVRPEHAELGTATQHVRAHRAVAGAAGRIHLPLPRQRRGQRTRGSSRRRATRSRQRRPARRAVPAGRRTCICSTPRASPRTGRAAPDRATCAVTPDRPPHTESHVDETRRLLLPRTLARSAGGPTTRGSMRADGHLAWCASPSSPGAASSPSPAASTGPGWTAPSTRCMRTA